MEEVEHQGSILIVDDTPANIQVLGPILSKVGYTVYVAQNGEDALLRAVKAVPDLILLDVMMPGIDGYETCRQLKEMQNLKDIPVIFLTACNDTDDLIKGFDVGGVDYISKPFNSRELLVRVRTHLELKFAREELSTLRGIIPICARCKKIRDDSGFWGEVETYIQEHSEAKFTHGICPTCDEELYGDKEWWQKKQAKLKGLKENREGIDSKTT